MIKMNMRTYIKERIVRVYDNKDIMTVEKISIVGPAIIHYDTECIRGYQNYSRFPFRDSETFDVVSASGFSRKIIFRYRLDNSSCIGCGSGMFHHSLIEFNRRSSRGVAVEVMGRASASIVAGANTHDAETGASSLGGGFRPATIARCNGSSAALVGDGLAERRGEVSLVAASPSDTHCGPCRSHSRTAPACRSGRRLRCRACRNPAR